jgi:glycerol-3-phosphate dehydrogenase
MSKTKTLRAKIADAFLVEQAVRELAAELEQEVHVSELMIELIKGIEDAKKRTKDKIVKSRKEEKN